MSIAQQRYYHGGAPGLKMILPSDKTGAPCTADFGAAGVCRRDRIYITNSFEAAAVFASLHPSSRGTIYEIEPIGQLETDPDFIDDGGEIQSWQCEAARVVRKFKLRRKDIMRLRRHA